MRTDSPWPGLSLVEFCDGLAEGRSGGAGAHAAVLLAAAGAALAANAQRGRPESEGAVYAAGRADELDALRERVLDRLEVQRELAGKFAKQPEGDELQKLNKKRVELVLETVEMAIAALRIAVVGAPETEGEQASDLAVAAGMLASAARAVEPEVRRSVASVSDAEWGERHRMAAESLIEESSALFQEVQTETAAS